jgi:hypothetical protein
MSNLKTSEVRLFWGAMLVPLLVASQRRKSV